jgi:hypothetical protein
MMIAAGSDALFTVIKHPHESTANQLARVSGHSELHDSLSELMGSRGLISFNQRIVFIEGTESSTDRAIFEAYYPPSKYNISFVPAGDSSTVRRTAARVNELLSASTGFQHYFSIVDRDLGRSESDPTGGTRLFRLPVYHVENFLLDITLMFPTTQEFLGASSPYSDEEALEAAMRQLVLEDSHLKPFSRALLDAQLAKHAKEAHDAVFQGVAIPTVAIPTFDDFQQQARRILDNSLRDGSWRTVVKGRELLKAFCQKHAITYSHFRNSVISKLTTPPQGLEDIMKHIHQQN